MKLAAAILLALRPWWPMIQSEARAEHVDRHELGAIVWHESRGNPNAFYQEKGGNCSIGLGGIYVPRCEPGRVARLRNPSFNLRTAAQMLGANRRYCRAHPREHRCAAGERVFRGGGAVNLYAGNTTRFAAELVPLKRQIARIFR
jgi:hypothetical protein